MSREHLKTVLRASEVIVDSTSGEVITSNNVSHRIMVGTPEEFFLGYASLLSSFISISGPAIKVYAYLLLHNKAGIPIAINGFIKNKIMEFIGSKSTGTIENALGDLSKAGLLYKPENSKGTYYINPRYAFKGSTAGRKESMKAIIELGCENC